MTTTIELATAGVSPAIPFDGPRVSAVIAGHLVTFERVAHDKRLGSLYTMSVKALPTHTIEREGA